MHRILSEQFGIDLVDRGDGHILIQILSEDDEHWGEHGSSFSSFWLNDLIKVLTITKATMSAMVKEHMAGGFPMAARCRIYEDDTGLYIKHGSGVGRPESNKIWNRVYPQSPTSFNIGDVVLKHHHSGTTCLRVRSLDQTVQEQWYIES